jgi:hypothetical protein
MTLCQSGKIRSLECLLIFSKDVVLSVIDVAKKYSFEGYNEIQKMH